MKWQTVNEMLACLAEAYPNALYARFLQKGQVVATYTYAQTWNWAARWAALLVERDVRRGQVVFIAVPNTDDFIGAYFGTLLAGGIPAPIAPFRRVSAGTPYLATVAQRIKFVDAHVLVVPQDQAEVAHLPPLNNLSDLQVVDRRDVPAHTRVPVPRGDENDLGMLQFTSGTSGNPKAVQLTHKALIAQTRNIATALALYADRAVSWLPFFHDMGLIGFLLTPASVPSCHVSLLLVEDFVMRPSLWIKALSDFRATITGAPPSAYTLCARRMKASEATQYDLSSLRVALVGAERVTLESLETFHDRLRPAGFRLSSLMPAYGLAENGLAVAMPPLGRNPKFDWIDPHVLHHRDMALPARDLDDSALAIASVGPPIPETELAIVDPAGKRLRERHIGEILVRSTSLMQGYYRDPETSLKTLRDGWLWTGDLGYCANGELYITGRKKEILIVGGSNYYPEELEKVAGEVPGVRLGRAVAIAYQEPKMATEEVVMLVETRLVEPSARDSLRQRIRQALVQSDYPVNQVVLVRPGTISYTQNGKVKRAECKARYLAGEFAPISAAHKRN